MTSQPEGTTRGPIGIFDSGIGGLTVAAAIRARFPSEDLFYIGDTARVPYGGKSRETIERYSREIGMALAASGARCIVAACNTASALAVPALRSEFSIPVLGVVEPGAAAAAAATRSGVIGVIGTRATVASGAYPEAILRHLPDAHVVQAACPLLVPLIEEGWIEDPIMDATLRRYLEPLLEKGIDTLVLGCTHYPLARAAIGRIVGTGVRLVDSAENCAAAVANLFPFGIEQAGAKGMGRLRILLTDPAGAFLENAAAALGLPLDEVAVGSIAQN